MKKRIFISHQSQCDKDEIKKLTDYLENLGFEIIEGSLNREEFEKEIATTESYVCILEKDSDKSGIVAQEIVMAVTNGNRVFAIFCPSVLVEISVPSVVSDLASGITNWDIEKLGKGLQGEDIGFVDQKGESKKVTVKVKKKGCN